MIWIKDLHIKVGDTESDEQLEKFMKVNENSELYKAQLKISAITNIKPNAWKETMVLTTSNSEAWLGNPGPTPESEDSTGS